MTKGTAYEYFTQEVYQFIVSDENFDTVEVEQDVSLLGRSGVHHQIDVYWKFEYAGVLHQVAIECKNYESFVNLGLARNFHAALLDIGNISGMMVTKLGFQSGVRKYASFYGVQLKLLQGVEEIDWAGKIKKIQISATMVLPEYSMPKVIIDEEWLKANVDSTLWDSPFHISGDADKIWVYNADGSPYKNFFELQNEHQALKEKRQSGTHSIKVDDKFIDASPEVGRVKLKEIEWQFRITESQPSITTIDAMNVIKAVVTDVKTESQIQVHNDGQVIKRKAKK